MLRRYDEKKKKLLVYDSDNIEAIIYS
jgi:hypothetical protein